MSDCSNYYTFGIRKIDASSGVLFWMGLFCWVAGWRSVLWTSSVVNLELYLEILIKLFNGNSYHMMMQKKQTSREVVLSDNLGQSCLLISLHLQPPGRPVMGRWGGGDCCKGAIKLSASCDNPPKRANCKWSSRSMLKITFRENL